MFKMARVGFVCVSRLAVIVAAAALMGSSGEARGEGDWLQWGGPSRDFKVDCDNLAKKWPKDGPPKIWEIELGDGYSAVSSDGKLLYAMTTKRKQLEEKKWDLEGQEAIVALDAATGKKRWEYTYDANWEKDMQMDFGLGPHSTPLVVGDRLFAVGCMCMLNCLDKNTGELIWSKDLRKEYEAGTLAFGYSASPLAYKDTIILPVGGEGKGVIALKQSDGTLIWKNQDSSGTHASPLLIDIDGEQQVVIFADSGASGLNPADGSLLWNAPHKTQWDANICTPVWCKDNILFVSSAYGNGARGMKISKEDGKWSAKELWYNAKMKIHHGNAVVIGDYVYGSSGDFGPAFFASVNIHTGEFGFKKRGITKATCVYGDKKLIVLDEDGRLNLARVSPKKMKILSKCEACTKIAWTVPTLVDGTLYVRDRKVLKAFDVSDGKKTAVSVR